MYQTFVDLLLSCLEKLQAHSYIALSQSEYLSRLKQDLDSSTIIQLGDFAENYAFVVQDEIQSSLHPVVVYYKVDEVLNHMSYSFISDGIVHDVTFVNKIIQGMIPELKKIISDLKKIIFTDGCAAQYTNCRNLYNLSKINEEFGISAEWNFFATSHGKSPCDGIGGTIKWLTAQESLKHPYRDQILTSDAMFEFCVNKIEGITFLYLKQMDLIRWFQDNYLKMNEDKCHLLITNQEEESKIAHIGDEIIKNSQSNKLLGITIDNEINFNKHVSTLCKKVNLKLHALARVANFMSTDKLRIIMKSFIESQFGYCPLVWMFHSRAINNQINKLHERALRLVYKDTTLSFHQLLQKDNSVTIHHRNLQKLATEMYKLKNNIPPMLLKTILPGYNHTYELRSENPFQTQNVRTVSNGTETIRFRGPKTWAIVPLDIKNSISLNEFKRKIKNWVPEGCTCRLCKIYVHNIGFLEI